MSEDVAAIGIEIRTTGAEKAKMSLEELANIAPKTEKSIDGVTRASQAAEKSLASLQKAAAGVVGVLGVRELVNLTDQYTKYTAQLKLASMSTSEYANSVNQVREIAKLSQQDLSATGMLYARIANGTREIGISQQRVADITKAASLSLKVSGATAAESASAMLQLSQAFGSGRLAGEEFNAVNEAAPRLMKALADGIGVPVGALKEMAGQGKITSEVMANALPRALKELNEEAKSVQTISGSITVLKNSVMEFVGTQAQASGVVKVLTTAIDGFANNLNLVTAAASGLAAAKLSEIMLGIGATTAKNVGSTLQYAEALAAQRAAAIAAAQGDLQATTAKIANLNATQAAIVTAREEFAAKLMAANQTIALSKATLEQTTATAALTLAEQQRAKALAELVILGQQQARVSAQITATTTAQTAAQTALNAATGAGGVAAGLATRTLGLLGGPIGAITTLLGLGATAWMLWGNATKSAQTVASEAVEQTTAEIIANLEKQNAKLRERIQLARQLGIAINEDPSKEQVRRVKLEKQIADLQAGKGLDGGAPLPEAARIGLMQTLLKQYAQLDSEIGNNKSLNAEASAIKSANALIEVRMRALGINKQYFEDLKSYQDALKSGAITEKQYIEYVSDLAKTTYESSTAGKEAAKAHKEGASAAKAEQSEYARLVASIKAKIAANDEELFYGGRLSDSDKLRIQLQAQLDAGAKKLTASHIANAKALLFTLDVQEREKEQAKRNIALYQQQIEMQAQVTDDYVKRSRVLESARQGMDAYETSAREEFGRLQLEAGLIGVSNQARAVALAQYDAEIELKRKLAEIDKMDTVNGESDREELRIRARGVYAQKLASAQTKAYNDEWNKSFDQASQSLTDALMAGGKNGAEYIEGLFRAMILRPVIQAAVAPVAGQIAGGVTSLLGGIGSVFGLKMNALGGVYDSPSLDRYVNQIHDTPKLFTFAKGGAPNVGMFAEAGEEAVMPLKRMSDGNLGVRAAMMPPKAGPTIVLSPTINIDSRADRAEVEALVIQGMNIAIKQAQAELIDKMSRGMA